MKMANLLVLNVRMGCYIDIKYDLSYGHLSQIIKV